MIRMTSRPPPKVRWWSGWARGCPKGLRPRPTRGMLCITAPYAVLPRCLAMRKPRRGRLLARVVRYLTLLTGEWSLAIASGTPFLGRHSPEASPALSPALWRWPWMGIVVGGMPSLRMPPGLALVAVVGRPRLPA